MIITRSPLRISLGGGGTDLASYYEQHTGFLIAAAIDKYVYITVHKTFVPELIIKYSKLERVHGVDEIEHPIIRESLRLSGGRPALARSCCPWIATAASGTSAITTSQTWSGSRSVTRPCRLGSAREPAYLFATRPPGPRRPAVPPITRIPRGTHLAPAAQWQSAKGSNPCPSKSATKSRP